MFRGKSNSCGTFFTKNSKLSARRNSIEMDFREKIVAKFRVGFREAKNETRREKRAKSVFRAKRKSAKRKTCGKNFFFFLRKSPYFLGKKLCLLKKGIFGGTDFVPLFPKNQYSLPSSLTFSASWVALCCWGSPSPRRCAPVRPPHGGAFAPSGRTLTGVGARPCKRRKKRLHAYASEAVVHPTDIQ